MKKILKTNKINLFYDPINTNSSKEFFQIDLKKNKSIRKILIIKWSAMGDIIIASGVINDILSHFDNHIVDLNTLPLYQKLFQQDKRIHAVWGNNFLSGYKKILSSIKWMKHVYKNNYDLIIDLQTNDRSRILLSFLKIFNLLPNYTIGNHDIFPYSISSKSKRKIYNPLFLMQSTLSTIGIKPKTVQPTVYISKISYNKIKLILRKNNLKIKKFIVFIPGSSSSNKLKRWGYKNFSNLFDLINKNNKKVLLVGGPEDINECNKIKKLSPKIINLCNKVEIEDLIALFDFAEFVISNDTGPCHLTACTRTKVIQITGPTDPQKVKPIGKNIISIQPELPCVNCYQKYCSHHSCMKNVHPEYIYNLISKNK